MHAIKPIRSEADHRAAIAEIDRLMDAAPGCADEDRLDVLATLVSAWEDEHVPLAAADPVEAIAFHMEQPDLSQAELAKLLGSRSRAPEIMSRSRRLTIAMVWKLRTERGIPFDALAAPYPVGGRAA